jgi:hypothetical protein
MGVSRDRDEGSEISSCNYLYRRRCLERDPAWQCAMLGRVQLWDAGVVLERKRSTSEQCRNKRWREK